MREACWFSGRRARGLRYPFAGDPSVLVCFDGRGAVALLTADIDLDVYAVATSASDLNVTVAADRYRGIEAL